MVALPYWKYYHPKVVLHCPRLRQQINFYKSISINISILIQYVSQPKSAKFDTPSKKSKPWKLVKKSGIIPNFPSSANGGKWGFLQINLLANQRKSMEECISQKQFCLYCQTPNPGQNSKIFLNTILNLNLMILPIVIVKSLAAKYFIY